MTAIEKRGASMAAVLTHDGTVCAQSDGCPSLDGFKADVRSRASSVGAPAFVFPSRRGCCELVARVVPRCGRAAHCASVRVHRGSRARRR